MLSVAAAGVQILLEWYCEASKTGAQKARLKYCSEIVIERFAVSMCHSFLSVDHHPLPSLDRINELSSTSVYAPALLWWWHV